MSKYPIDHEFFPFNLFVPPINPKFLKLAKKYMKAPRKFLNAKGFEIRAENIETYDNESVGYYIITPDNVTNSSPCLFYIHGGGFVLKAAGYHYMNCLEYAKECKCRVIFPDYRLAPDYPFPAFYEDCYSIFNDIYSRSNELGIDSTRIGIGGDSAGSTLAAGLCIMLKTRNHPVNILFQMLPYPFLDARNSSESCRKYTDTPMWNSSLSEKIGPMTKVTADNPDYLWYSPIEYQDYSVFPPSYIETAEFDCLHDDGILFYKKLKETGTEAELNETKGTMHGYDIIRKASVSKASVKRRIDFMNRFFYC